MKERFIGKAIINFAVAVMVAATFAPVRAQIIPADRRYDWTPGVNVGVPGGIPHRTTIGARVDSAAYGTGTVDASAGIGAAIDACPSGQVVYIPAGTYRVDSRIYRAYAGNITVRGAGMGKTILKGASSEGILLFGSSDWPRATVGVPIVSGATQGSTVLTVTSTSTITVGSLARVEQNNLPYVISAEAPTTDRKVLTAVFKVTAKTATTVTITPALPFTFTQTPMLVPYAFPPINNTGLEDLTLDCNSKAAYGVSFEHAYGCWVKNVEIKNAPTRQIMLSVGFICGEIRHCYTHDGIGGGPNHEGIDLFQDGCFNLIEDNICYNGGFPGIILGDWKGGCAGNVIAYNFVYGANTGDPTMAGMDISFSHGPHNMMNLAEGNIAGGLGSDGYFGSASHNTVLRNWFTATHPTGTDNLIAVNISRWNTYFNLVGNVLGTSTFSSSGLFQPEVPFNYSDQVIYKLGFPNMGNNSFSQTWGPTNPPDYTGQYANQPGSPLQELDLNVKNTMIRHGNYDYRNKTVAWDPAISDHNIPNSYFRTSKPAYFGNLAWPPFDPANPPGAFDSTNISRIPAGYRFVHGVDPEQETPEIRSTGALANSAGAVQILSSRGSSTVLKIDLGNKPGQRSISIRDTRGRLLGRISVQGVGTQTVQWNTASLGNGLYFVDMKPCLLVK